MKGANVDRLGETKRVDRQPGEHWFVDMNNIKLLFPEDCFQPTPRPGEYVHPGGRAATWDVESWSTEGDNIMVKRLLVGKRSKDLDLVSHLSEVSLQTGDMFSNSTRVGIVVGGNKSDLHGDGPFNRLIGIWLWQGDGIFQSTEVS